MGADHAVLVFLSVRLCALVCLFASVPRMSCRAVCVRACVVLVVDSVFWWCVVNFAWPIDDVQLTGEPFF